MAPLAKENGPADMPDFNDATNLGSGENTDLAKKPPECLEYMHAHRSAIGFCGRVVARGVTLLDVCGGGSRVCLGGQGL